MEDKYTGKLVFDVAQGSPETLKGTNGFRWIVYYEELDITFTVTKETNIITSYKQGKHPIDESITEGN